jgi:hypothetical protein
MRVMKREMPVSKMEERRKRSHIRIRLWFRNRKRRRSKRKHRISELACSWGRAMDITKWEHLSELNCKFRRTFPDS